MPNGKPAGVRCIQLDTDNRCKIFGRPERPLVCGQLGASHEMCGSVSETGNWVAANAHAMHYLSQLEVLTAP